ncbi:hypothetical protein NLI96_g7070 [Meripilus lineatus]|uniref:DUF6535 domain-containing protein n=1 Tax=Meripilus lineatus TaxID=2056292 RepID=A0AAD5YFC9_9APHY|nr:hypothetical protein NLI96_g7070 [Physisporinus lineatus]
MSTSPHNDPIPGSTTSNNIPLRTMASTSPEDTAAGPSSTQNVPEGGLPTNQKEDATQATSKENRLDQLKREFVEKCAKIDEEYPELAHKDGWSVLHEMLKIRDEKDIKKHFENIDTLLVFAGLYSAILTAFLVEAYKLLQPDSSDDSRQILLEISRQLASFTVTSGLVNATYVPSSLPTGPFTPKQSSVWLNGLWFVALVLSLTTASLGLLVKQWLRECADNPGITPEEHRRIRAFRSVGLRWYKVYEMAAILPLLLQISLILFLTGLVLFTRTVHATIGRVIMGLVVAWGAFLVITTILPWFSASCPYKTPFLKSTTLQFKRLLNYLNKSLESFAEFIQFDWLYRILPSELFDSETGISKDSSWDVEVLLDAYETSENANVWETIMHCVDLQRPSESFTHLCEVITRIYPSSEPSTDLASKAWIHVPSKYNSLFVKSLSTSVRWRLIQAFEKKEGSGLSNGSVELLLQLNRCNHFLTDESSSRMDRALVEMSSALLRASLSAPFTRGSLVKYASGLLTSGVNTLRRWEYFDKTSEYRATTLRSLRFSRHCLAMSASIEASKQVFDPSNTLEDENEVLRQSLGILFCAGRSTEECWPVLKNEFPHLSGLIARKVDALQNPSGWQHSLNTFQWHCVLDMAMRLHKRTPDIIDKALFEALNTFSVKMFDLYVGHEVGEIGKFTKYIRKEAERESLTLDEVLDRYVEVEVRGKGEYREYKDKWDSQRLRVDYRHRMEFMLNYEWYWDDEIRGMVTYHKF